MPDTRLLGLPGGYIVVCVATLRISVACGAPNAYVVSERGLREDAGRVATRKRVAQAALF
jgi:hypothetical protein